MISCVSGSWGWIPKKKEKRKEEKEKRKEYRAGIRGQRSGETKHLKKAICLALFLAISEIKLILRYLKFEDITFSTFYMINRTV
jgi:hypothetical protein